MPLDPKFQKNRKKVGKEEGITIWGPVDPPQKLGIRGSNVAVDWDLCTGCKACLKQCQFGAQFYSSTLSKVHIDPLRCFGCGVCRAVCPHDAIALIPREEHPEAAELWLR